MGDTYKVLPQDCWKLIFSRLDILEDVSLVCKEFYSISNSLIHSIELYEPTVQALCRLLKRFPDLKEIDLRLFHGDLDLALTKIARSGLNLEALYVSFQSEVSLEIVLQPRSLREIGRYMKKLKTLEFSFAYFLQDRDLATIASSLPWLEELDISDSWTTITDEGIELLSSKLRLLRKIDISGNSDISDRSLVALSLNCVFLREIVACDCDDITQNCIGFLFRHSPKLVSLSVDHIRMDYSCLPSCSLFTIANSISYAKALSALKIPCTPVSDSHLSSIAEVHLPLKKLSLGHCHNFTISGLLSLLRACQFLDELDLRHVKILTDEDLSDLSQYLRHLTYINLNGCRSLTSISSFFVLTKNCPSLEEIKMKNTRVGAREYFGLDLVKNNCIQSLDLDHSGHLNDELLKKIGLSCPNLKFLNVGYCGQITNEGIEEIFKSCQEIRHLEINYNRDAKIFGTHSELSELKLELLEARGTMIDDGGLAMIAKRCSGLQYLNLNDCSEVTTRGVKEVVEKCTKLKEINLYECCNVGADILVSMVCSRPFMRRTIPCHFVPNKDQILHHGVLWF